MNTATVDVATKDGNADAYLVCPDGGPHPAVLFYMDGFGLRQVLYEMAERIASHGYVVLLPNLFYRDGRTPLMDVAELLKPGGRPKLMAAVRRFALSLTAAAKTRDAGCYLDFLAAQDQVSPRPVGVVGYCMGGGWALQTAGHYPDRVAAAAIFHGGGLATDAADSPHLLAGRIRAELYFGHADQDPGMPAEQIERLTAALDTAGVRYRSEVYPGAVHGYTMRDTLEYNAAATDRHWTELAGLFDRTLAVTR